MTLKEYFDNLRGLDDEIKDTLLFHYTTNQGLAGINESKSFHLTDFTNFNDKQEVSLGYQKATERILEKLKESTNVEFALDAYSQESIKKNGDVRTDLQSFKKGVSNVSSFLKEVEEQLNQSIEKKNEIQAYIMCFSEKEDLLCQWKGYAGFGAGYCLGIKTRRLIEILQDDIEKTSKAMFSEPYKFMVLNKVVYNEVDFNKKVDDLIAIIDALVVSTKTDESEKKGTLKFINFILTLLSIFFKAEPYKEEEEWRLVVINYEDLPKQLIVKPSIFGLSTCYNLSFENSSLDDILHEIFIGPKYDFARNQKVISTFITPNKIKKSKFSLQ